MGIGTTEPAVTEVTGPAIMATMRRATTVVIPEADVWSTSAVRPIEASKTVVSDVRNTSTPAGSLAHRAAIPPRLCELPNRPFAGLRGRSYQRTGSARKRAWADAEVLAPHPPPSTKAMTTESQTNAAGQTLFQRPEC
jgi:hypothetical protein